jgi:tetratricopeptide (TPR) repeat protein
MGATRQELDQLFHDLEAARATLDRDEVEPARKAFARVRRWAKRLGVRSSYLLWSLSHLHQRQGRVEWAYRAIGEALVMDPLHPNLQERFAELARAVREALERRSHAATDRSCRRLYDALLRTGEADWTSHLAIARHDLARGRVEEAGKVLGALTLLEPNRAEAWRMYAEQARKAEDLDRFEACLARAGAAEVAVTPYGTPSPAARC